MLKSSEDLLDSTQALYYQKSEKELSIFLLFCSPNRSELEIAAEPSNRSKLSEPN
jgi:hypothetical protein